jgi:uncharacterized protein
MNFKMFEKTKIEEPVQPSFMQEPQGMLRKSAAVKTWDKIGVGKAGDGNGVYAIDDIADNELIEECYVIETPFTDVQGTVLIDYMFKVNNDLYVLALGAGSNYNHRNQPNARWEYDQDKKLLKIFATRPIQCGEEIYISYGRAYYNTRNENMKK